MRNSRKLLSKPNFWILVFVAAQVAAIIFLCLFLPAFLPVTITYAVMRILTAVIAVVLLLRCSAAEVKCAWFTLLTLMPAIGSVGFLISSARKKPQGILKLKRGAGVTVNAGGACADCASTPVKAIRKKSDGSADGVAKSSANDCADCAHPLSYRVSEANRAYLKNSVIKDPSATLGMTDRADGCDGCAGGDAVVSSADFTDNRRDDNAVETLSRAAGRYCGTVAAGYTETEYFSSGVKFWNRATALIANAKKSVFIEFFIICRGHLFTSVLEAIKKARSNGAEIKIICDGFGSGMRLNRKDLKRLKEAGAEIKTFNRLRPFPHSNINLRDHRKIITVDGRAAFTGGVNLADEYINLNSPYGFWKDTGVAVYGEAAKLFEGMFLAMWKGVYEMPAPKLGEKNCLPYCDGPDCRSFCEDAYIWAINGAKNRVHIFTPYFCASDKAAAALGFAARRGVDVKVIIPHIPDKKYAFEVSKAFARQLQPSGVKFFEFTPGFLHAKTLICDDKVFLGSYNFDFRSTHYNYECGVMFEGDVCDEVERDFESSLLLSAEMHEGRLSRRKRLSLFILRLFSPLI